MILRPNAAVCTAAMIDTLEQRRLRQLAATGAKITTAKTGAAVRRKPAPAKRKRRKAKKAR